MSARALRVAIVAAAGVLAIATGLSQTRGGGPVAAPSGGTTGAAGTTGTTGGLGTTSPTVNNNPTNNTNNNTPYARPPIMLTGQVLLEDGSPPPESAKIERICSGSSRTEGFTDSKGYFSIQIGDEAAVFQDASEQTTSSTLNGGMAGMSRPGTLGPAGSSGTNSAFGVDQRLMNCDLRADVTGYRSQLVSLANRHPLDTPDLGTILLHRLGPGEGDIVSANTLAAPNDARKAFLKGQDLLKKRKVDDAFKQFQKAVMLYPSFSAAWCELGKLEDANNQRDIARGSFNEAIKADPKFVEPYIHVSRLAADAKNWRELADTSGKVIELDSFDYPEEFLYNAAAHYNLHDLDEAEKSLRRAELLDTRHQFPEILNLKGLILAQHHDYAGAIEQLREFLKTAPDSPNAPTARVQLAQIEKAQAQLAAAKPDAAKPDEDQQ